MVPRLVIPIALLATLAWMHGAALAAEPTVVYTSDFSKGATAEWSKKSIETSPNGKRKFLGRFGREQVSLTLNDLPEHARIRITFDLIFIRSWDGSTPGAGPDVLDITVDHGPRLMHASFSSAEAAQPQSFPGEFPHDTAPSCAGVDERNTLGYAWDNGQPSDYVNHLTRKFGHTGKSLTILFTGINLEEVNNESWGLDKVKVEVMAASSAGAEATTRPVDARVVGNVWDTLAQEDPVAAQKAIDTVMLAGDGIVPLLREKLTSRLTTLDPMSDAKLAEIRKLIAQLDDDDFLTREKASNALEKMVALAEPELRRTLMETRSPEVKSRVEDLLARLPQLTPGVLTDANERRECRVVRILEWIGTDEAKKLLADIARSNNANPKADATAALLRLSGRAPTPTPNDKP